MTSGNGEASRARPVILGSAGAIRSIRPPRGGGSRVEIRGGGKRTGRLNQQFEDAQEAFNGQVQLTSSIPAADPQLVLVFEAIDEQIDLQRVAGLLGMEILIESEDGIEPSEEYVLTVSQPRNPLITTCLHAICLNQQAFDRLLAMWRGWKRDGTVPYRYAPLRELFGQLKDVRPWGPKDRLKMIDWEDYFEGLIDGRPHHIEIELWYRGSQAARSAAQSEVEYLVRDAGGTVGGHSVISSIGYHGLSCVVPTGVLLDLVNQRFDSVQMVKSANVMYLRVSGQAMPISGPPIETSQVPSDAPPQRPPVVCLLDGVPASNHPRLRDRVLVFDPDDLESQSTVEERRHGTWMASTVVWGDLSAGEAAIDRQVLVRPILAPSDDTTDRGEELQRGELAPDLMWRIFRELFEPQGDSGSVAPEVLIINLSVGDPATPFETLISSWARMVDWLSYEYGVLVVISAGNYPSLSLRPSNTEELLALPGRQRRLAVLDAQHRDQFQRRLISPAESINAITVGAVHRDSSGVAPIGYTADPTDGLVSVSPITPIGSGYRRSVKPDLAADGGRVLFRSPPVPADEVRFNGTSSRGPGIRVAAPSGGQETFIAGTSPAAALITRRASRIHDVVQEITAGSSLSRRQRAAAIKALLVHGVGPLDNFEENSFPLEQAIGNGVYVRDLSEGCASNEAVILFFGSLGAAEEQDLSFPLPNGLSVREVKRIDATVAWFSPINWRHRQYRRAALSFVKPSGSIPQLGTPVGLSSNVATRGAATVHHQRWETSAAFAGGQGSDMGVRVKCFEQAGGLNGERIDFAAVLSLWVAPVLNVDVYSQVRQQVQSRVGVRS